MTFKRRFSLILIVIAAILLASCEASVQQIIPTTIPSVTPSRTPSPSNTPRGDITPTRRPTTAATRATGGPSPTPLLGASQTPLPGASPTATRVFNPNAPRIEFFTSDVLWIEPGGDFTLHWSIRGVDNAFLYRLNRDGTRSRVWNVGPDGSQFIDTRSNERGDVAFLLTAGENELYVEQGLSIPIRCPVEWFFSPPPDQCPNDISQQTTFLEQSFERGRMFYIESLNNVYVLFNDGNKPAWLAFSNRYNPEVHPEIEESFRPPTGFYQPRAELGLIWRGNDTVRNRLGLGTAEANLYLGLYQTSTEGGSETLFVNSTSGQVIQLVPGGDVWQIISLP